MAGFVKAGAVKSDKRSEEDKARDTADALSRDMMHLEMQLRKKGHSITQVIAASAKHQFGVDVQPHMPVKLFPPTDEEAS